MNSGKPPFDNKLVRQAIATADDRDEVTQAARFDAARANETAIPKDSFFYYDYEPFKPDADKAKQLVQQAGVATPMDVGQVTHARFPPFMPSWVGNIDPADFYEQQHITDGSSNYQGYSNPQVDQLLTQASTELAPNTHTD